MISEFTETEANEILAQYEVIAEVVHSRLLKNRRVRRNLPEHGRIRIDRQLPFLCIYRQPFDRPDPGTRELVTTEAAYLFGTGKREHHRGIMSLCQNINLAMAEQFGPFLIIEIWSQPQPPPAGELAFGIVTPDAQSIPSTVSALQRTLENIQIFGRKTVVSIRECHEIQPPGLEPLEAVCSKAGPEGCCQIGLAISPVYRDADDGTLFPLVLNDLRKQLAIAIRQSVAEFTGTTSKSAASIDAAAFHMLGPSSLVKAAKFIDQRLREVSESFDFLLQVTPINADAALEEFQSGGFKTLPTLHYRPLPFHPNLIKRRLFDIEIERIEDPTLAHLCWEKQEQLDLQLTALREIGSPDFLYSSLQLYGEPDENLLELARNIISRLPDTTCNTETTECLQADQLLDRVRAEFDYYRSRLPEFDASVVISDEIVSGIMVSRDRLIISPTVKLSARRVEGLMHHEVGTHLLTYFNGRCQPFQQLYAGLSGYEELQEGLAVLAECLVGGMTTTRWRTLAARVFAVHSMVSGASFADTYALLHEEASFSELQAFRIALRVYRGGGLTKDLIYLRGLCGVMKYLAAGHDIEPLYIGKIGLQHIPLVQEMRRRKIIVPPGVLPRFCEDDEFRTRLEAIRHKSVLELLETVT